MNRATRLANVRLRERQKCGYSTSLRIRAAFNNVTNERVPLAHVSLPYFADVHRDPPFRYYIDVPVDFWVVLLYEEREPLAPFFSIGESEAEYIIRG